MISLKNIVSFIGFKDFNVKNNLLKPRKKKQLSMTHMKTRIFTIPFASEWFWQFFYLGVFFIYRKRENHVKLKHKMLERKT